MSTRWSGEKPFSISAIGSSAEAPARISPAASCGSVETPMSTTSVAPVPSRAAKPPSSSSSNGTWPEATVKARETSRKVSGMPAAPGTATAEVIPGTVSTGTPQDSQSAASSPPRPKT